MSDVAPDIYQGPAPDVLSSEVVHASSSLGDVYAGAPEGDVYAGDSHEGSGLQGDVYQGPLPGADPEDLPESGEINLLRAVFFGLLGCVLAVGLWYGVAMATGNEFGILALVLGLVVGFCTVSGAGRGGSSVAVVSVALFVSSMIWGEFLINKGLMEDLDIEMARYEAAAAAITRDGRYTPEEARILMGYSTEEWSEMSSEERGWLEEEIEYEDQEALSEGWDPEEDGAAEPFQPLTFGAFLSMLPFYLGFKGFLFLGIGAFEAWKVPMANV